MNTFRKAALCASIVVTSITPLVATSARAVEPAKEPNTPKTYVGEIESRYVHEKISGTFIRFRLEGNSLFVVRILFDKDSGKATSAIQMTKGVKPIGLPREGLLFKDVPPEGSRVRVTFDGSLPEPGAVYKGYRRLVSIKASDDKGTQDPAK